MKLDEAVEEDEAHLHHLHEAHHQVLILRATQHQHRQLQPVHIQRATQLQQHQLLRVHTQKAMEHQHQLRRLVIQLHLHTVDQIQATLLQHDKPLHIQQLLIIGQLSTLTE